MNPLKLTKNLTQTAGYVVQARVHQDQKILIFCNDVAQIEKALKAD